MGLLTYLVFDKFSSTRRETRSDSLCQDEDSKKSVMERAQKVLQNIPDQYPKFAKPMVESSVSKSFWLVRISFSPLKTICFLVL